MSAPVKAARVTRRNGASGEVRALREENTTLRAELAEAREQQTATAEVLQTISRSAFDLDSVLQTLVDSAVRLCGAGGGTIYRVYGNSYRWAAWSMPGFEISGEAVADHSRNLQGSLPDRGTMAGRVASERRVVHCADVQTDPEFSEAYLAVPRTDGSHGHMGVPMFRGDELVGVLVMLRTEAEAFSLRQEELVRTFADQAVIAIENARLVGELQESLEQQTATAEILGVISRSPTDIQPVLDTIVHHAAALCHVEDARLNLSDGHYRWVAARRGRWAGPAEGERIDMREATQVPDRVILEHRTVRIPDTQDPSFAAEYPAALAFLTGARSIVSVPLLSQDRAVGAISVSRQELAPFTDREVRLLQTFADQAVIAIENVRLFTELQQRTSDLQEALEQQTATSEVLQTISRSAFDLDSVLQTLVDSAARLCRGPHSSLHLLDGGVLRIGAVAGMTPEERDYLEQHPFDPSDEGRLTSRAMRHKTTVHVHDAAADPAMSADESGPHHRFRLRTGLGVPLMRSGQVIGTFGLWR
ncbi:MAG TPA: GAF domain-containing protein, partial [Chloroflexota bacterium]